MSSKSYLSINFLNLTISQEILFSLFRFRAVILFIYLLNYIAEELVGESRNLSLIYGLSKQLLKT